MQKMSKILSCAIFLFNQFSWASEPISAVGAQTFLLSFATTNDVLKFLKLNTSAKEADDLKDYLLSQGVKLGEKLPEFAIENKKIMMGKESIELNGDQTISYNGIKFKYDPKQTLKQNFLALVKPKKSISLFNLLIPEANAVLQALGVALAGAGAMLALAVVVQVYDEVTKKLADERARKEAGNTSCDHGNYVINFVTKNGQSGNLITGISKKIVYLPQNLKTFGITVADCTPELAKLVQNEMKLNPNKLYLPASGKN